MRSDDKIRNTLVLSRQGRVCTGLGMGRRGKDDRHVTRLELQALGRKQGISKERGCEEVIGLYILSHENTSLN